MKSVPGPSSGRNCPVSRGLAAAVRTRSCAPTKSPLLPPRTSPPSGSWLNSESNVCSSKKSTYKCLTLSQKNSRANYSVEFFQRFEEFMISLIPQNHVKVFYLQIQTIVNRFEHLVVLRWPRQPSDVERVDDLREE
jgi:hypothetical protein